LAGIVSTCEVEGTNVRNPEAEKTQGKKGDEPKNSPFFLISRNVVVVVVVDQPHDDQHH
jgi:hypothetical protein